MEKHLLIRALLTYYFPNVETVFITSNTKRNILMWELTSTKFYNFEVDRDTVYNVLTTAGPFKDCYEFFEKINVPRHAIDDFKGWIRTYELIKTPKVSG